jgi:hypothetical protein
MRGFPVLRLFFLATALVLAAIPVWSLTRTGTEHPVPGPSTGVHAATEKITLEILLTSSAPGTLCVSSLGRTLLKSGSGARSLAGKIEVFRNNPDDIVVSAAWDFSSGPGAIRAEAWHDGAPVADSTFWGDGPIEDVLPLP